MIVLPRMPAAQSASWSALLDLHERVPRHWTLIGGQLVHLLCAERGGAPPRPTMDADAVLDVREDAQVLLRVTRALDQLGFRADGISAEGHQHRWRRDLALLDVLIPRGVGVRLPQRTGVTGSVTVQAPGGAQALRRTQRVEVALDGRIGAVLRPNLVGALVVKAAAHAATATGNRRRHLEDFADLAALVRAADFEGERLTATDRRHLRRMVEATCTDSAVMAGRGAARDGLERLGRRLG
jgi:hypothetical protein